MPPGDHGICNGKDFGEVGDTDKLGHNWTKNIITKTIKMTEDKFAKEMLDKMNHGVSRLSPIAHQLYFSLTFEFLSRGRENTIRTSLLSYAKHLGISDKSIKDISKQIENAFDEIHTHTFVRYKFEIIAGSPSEQPELFVSVIDNSQENTAIIERIYKDKNSLH